MQHCTNQALSDQATQFRSAYGMKNGTNNRTMQRDLIVEEFQEFLYAQEYEGYEEELKELADLVYVCFQYAENMEWDLEEALCLSLIHISEPTRPNAPSRMTSYA